MYNTVTEISIPISFILRMDLQVRFIYQGFSEQDQVTYQPFISQKSQIRQVFIQFKDFNQIYHFLPKVGFSAGADPEGSMAAQENTVSV